MKNKKILLISHDSSLTGASLSFYKLAVELSKINSNIRFDILLMSEGALVKKYCENFQDVYFPYPVSESFIRRNFRKIGRKADFVKSYKEKLLDKLVRKQYDLIIGNTIGTLNWLCKLKAADKKVKTIIAIHELKIVINNYFPDLEIFTRNIGKCDFIIAVSDVTKFNLVNNYSVESDKIKVIRPYCISVNDLKKEIVKKKSSTFRVGLVGYLSLIKGSDLVPQIAFLFNEKLRFEDFSFTFFGVENIGAQNIIRSIILNDAAKLGIADKISFNFQHKSPELFFENMDVFLMISREESFSLTTIESIMSETPIVLFDLIGGPNEILNNDEAYFSPYLDVSSIAQNLGVIYSDYSEAIKKIKVAKERLLKINNQYIKEYKVIIDDNT